MRLDDQAIRDLSIILAKETGSVIFDFSHEELNEVGELLLTVLAESLKIEK